MDYRAYPWLEGNIIMDYDIPKEMIVSSAMRNSPKLNEIEEGGAHYSAL